MRFRQIFPLFTAALLAAASSANATLIINEMLSDPHPDQPPMMPNGDANGDGTRDGSEDEFVEFYNTSMSSLDISGWTVSDAVGLRHTFPMGTVLLGNQALVLFGGPTPTGSFGGAIVQTASTGFLGLNNGGDTVTVNDGMMDVITETSGGTDQSLTRSPDITGATFVDHTSTPAGLVHSPGFQIDGVTPLGVPEPGSAMLIWLGLIGAMALRRR